VETGSWVNLRPGEQHAELIQVTPFMHVDNLDRALAFFTDIPGFETPLPRR